MVRIPIIDAEGSSFKRGTALRDSPHGTTRRHVLAAASAVATGIALGPSFRNASRAVAASDPDQEFAGLVDIGGRSIWVDRRGSGEPTVILESGFGNNGQIWDTIALAPGSTKQAVLPAVANFTHVFSYDRPGTMIDASHRSRTEPVPMPRTAADVVADLHALLQAADVPGPYVLVGHSFGGVVMRLFAAAFPNDVVGMVLVDAADEGLHDRLRAGMSAEHWTAY